MFVAGVDGCRAGWVAFKVEVPSLATSVDVVDLPKLLSSRADEWHYRQYNCYAFVVRSRREGQ